jgi:hypothetical protein
VQKESKMSEEEKTVQVEQESAEVTQEFEQAMDELEDIRALTVSSHDCETSRDCIHASRPLPTTPTLAVLTTTITAQMQMRTKVSLFLHPLCPLTSSCVFTESHRRQ